MPDLWIPPGADVPPLRKVEAAVANAPPAIRPAVAGAAVAELRYQEKKLRRAAARTARKARKAQRKK